MNVEIDISEVVLRTPRLVLRAWRQSDLQDFFEYASVDGVGQMAGWHPHENVEKSQLILDDFIKGKKTFCIEYQSKAIGSLGIEKYNENEFPEYANLKGRELGFVLSKDYWGRGIMPEAVKAVMEYCRGRSGFSDVRTLRLEHAERASATKMRFSSRQNH